MPASRTSKYRPTARPGGSNGNGDQPDAVELQAQGDARLLETQNDARLEELSSKVSALRNVTIDVYNEVEAQHRLLDATNQTFHSFGTRLQSTARRFQRVIARTSARQMWYYALAMFVSLWVLYFLFKTWHRQTTPTESP
ncbi:hypothetical protein H4R35_001708 [Dimargaris xerosporica]|nr:hypothetical protein H4R35_001708 [Dimargaris xerosporica]